MIPSDLEFNNLLHRYQNGQHIYPERTHSLTERFPKHPFGWQVLSARLGQTGRIAETVTVCQKSVALSPQDASTHNNLRNTLQQLGKIDQSKAS